MADPISLPSNFTEVLAGAKAVLDTLQSAMPALLMPGAAAFVWFTTLYYKRRDLKYDRDKKEEDEKEAQMTQREKEIHDRTNEIIATYKQTIADQQAMLEQRRRENEALQGKIQELILLHLPKPQNPPPAALP